MLKIDITKKSYGSHTVLSNVSFSLMPGRIYGLVGKNGAGKSTLLKCISNFEQFDGNLHSSHPNLRQVIGYLETHPNMLDRMTGEEFISLLCLARQQQIPDLKQCNLFNLPLKQYAAQYSTGMKKKLVLTGILLQQNEILLLDEPFNGVDLQSNLMVIELLKTLKKQNKIIVIASHILETLYDIADEIFFLNEQSIKAFTKSQFPNIKQHFIGESMTTELKNFLDHITSSNK